MPHLVKTEEELDFILAEATKTLTGTQTIRLTTSTAVDGRVKMKFKTKKGLYTYIVASKDTGRIEGKYAKITKQ